MAVRMRQLVDAENREPVPAGTREDSPIVPARQPRADAPMGFNPDRPPQPTAPQPGPFAECTVCHQRINQSDPRQHSYWCPMRGRQVTDKPTFGNLPPPGFDKPGGF
jgi:hypothetical protein